MYVVNHLAISALIAEWLSTYPIQTKVKTAVGSDLGIGYLSSATVATDFNNSGLLSDDTFKLRQFLMAVHVLRRSSPLVRLDT